MTAVYNTGNVLWQHICAEGSRKTRQGCSVEHMTAVYNTGNVLWQHICVEGSIRTPTAVMPSLSERAANWA